MNRIIITVAKTPRGYSASCELLEGWIVAVTGSFEDLKLQVKDSIDFYVSGYRAKLDSIEVYSKTRTVFVRERAKRKRFGLGVQAGYGFSGNKVSPYVGVGVSYSFWEW